jgi:ParB family chromosome partitioning protein
VPPRSGVKAVSNVVAVPLEQIRPDANNARKVFDADELEALAADIKRHGQLQNAVAFQDRTTGEYHLIAGERRFRACKLAGVATLVCQIVPREIESDVREEMAFAENMSRSQLRPTEVAAHWKRLLERWNCSTRELAARIGVSQSTISKRLSLLKLNTEGQAAVDAGVATQTSAVASTGRKRTNTGSPKPRGVVELNAGTVKVKRGRTLAELHAELTARLNATDGKAAA